MSKKTWISVVAVLAVVLTIVAWVTSKQADHTGAIKIGAISPFTGEGANYGKAARSGIDMAVDEINARGGIRGAKLTVVYEDDKGSPKDALSAFNKLATIDKVPAILGPFYSGNVLAVAPEAERLRVVVLTGSATSDNIRNAGEYIFRTCPSNDAHPSSLIPHLSSLIPHPLTPPVFRAAVALQRSPQSLAAPLTPLESPCMFRTSFVRTTSENTQFRSSGGTCS